MSGSWFEPVGGSGADGDDVIRGDLGDLGRRADEVEARYRDAGTAVAALGTALAGLTATGRSDDGLAAATVDAAGTLTALDLDPAVTRLPAERIAADVLGAVAAARAAVAARAERTAGDVPGGDGPAARALLEAVRRRLQAPGDDDAAR
jgi:hypothetical protein